MIEIIRSLIIGGVQGVSEFLPISSSGHLVLIPYVFKWNYNGLAFDIALHFGTVIAIVAYFWKDWMSIITSGIKNFQFKISNLKSNPNDQMTNSKYPPNLLWQILVASIPAMIFGLLFNDLIDKTFHSSSNLGMIVIAINLIIFGVVLWLVDKKSKSILKIKSAKYWNTFLIGLAQCIALVPGVSRSGITMTAGRALGLDRKSSARFSFLLATPAMLGAFVLSLKHMQQYNVEFILGTLSSAIFGFFAIKYLLKYLEKGSFSVFVWYRIILAFIIFAIYFTR